MNKDIIHIIWKNISISNDISAYTEYLYQRQVIDNINKDIVLGIDGLEAKLKSLGNNRQFNLLKCT